MGPPRCSLVNTLIRRSCHLGITFRTYADKRFMHNLDSLQTRMKCFLGQANKLAARTTASIKRDKWSISSITIRMWLYLSGCRTRLVKPCWILAWETEEGCRVTWYFSIIQVKVASVRFQPFIYVILLVLTMYFIEFDRLRTRFVADETMVVDYYM